MINAILPPRGCDEHGCGHWNAPRGSRRHKGVDVACYPGTVILSLTTGTVTKIGYPYNPESENGHMKYVEVTNEDGLRFRYFYVTPMVQKDDRITIDTPLGKILKHTAVERGMTSHLHLEIKDGDGNYIDPTPFMKT